MHAFNASHRLFCIALLALSGPLQAQAGAMLSCVVAEEDANGKWVASRDLTVGNGVIHATRDDYEWRPKAAIAFGPGMTMRWNLSYWPAQTAGRNQAGLRGTPPAGDVLVSLDFWFDAQKTDSPPRNPQRSWIHLYRSSNPEHAFSPSDTSLTSIMFWQQNTNGNLDTKAVIPLDALLAYGTGFDTLVWNIRSDPNDYGGTHALAKGLLPIAAMRGKLADIPRLRRLLDKKQAAFATECDFPPMAPPMPG